MKKNMYSLIAFAILMISSLSNTANAQCMDWVAPTDSTGWVDFNNSFGGAPCDDGNGCPFNEINAFEVFAAEAYTIDNFLAGGEYVFSMCNGPGVGAWVPEFTIIAPSGAVDAFGAGDGDACTITWTASEDGTYLIVINEAGECGGGPNTGTGNGFPAISCNSGAPCDPNANVCNSGTLTTTGTVTVCDAVETFDLMTETDTTPAMGGTGWSFSDQLGGTGGLAGGFSITNSSNTVSWNSDLGGVLSANGLPVLSGPWVVFGLKYADANDAIGSICSITTDSLIVNFGSFPIIDDIQDVGSGSAAVTVSGGVPPFTYLWDDANAQTTDTAVGLDPGTYSVTVTGAFGCTATDMVDITSTAVDNIEAITSLQIAPNPTTNRFSVQLALNATEEITIDVMDISGKPVTSQTETTSGNSFEFDLSGNPAGIYLVKIMVGDQFLSRRVILTK